MIDRNARNRLAENIRHFVAGCTDNFTYDDAVWSIHTQDRAVIDIRQAMWHVYDDLYRHTLTNQWALAPEQRASILRCLLFLKSTLEYQWPKKPILPRWFGTAIALFNKSNTQQVQGNALAWPFFSSDDVVTVNRNPVYLAKHSDDPLT